jgi:hypothetical protein
MKVIVHETVSYYGDAISLAKCVELGQEEPAIVVVTEYRLTMITSVVNVITVTWVKRAGKGCH